MEDFVKTHIIKYYKILITFVLLYTIIVMFTACSENISDSKTNNESQIYSSIIEFQNIPSVSEQYQTNYEYDIPGIKKYLKEEIELITEIVDLQLDENPIMVRLVHGDDNISDLVIAFKAENVYTLSVGGRNSFMLEVNLIQETPHLIFYRSNSNYAKVEFNWA